MPRAPIRPCAHGRLPPPHGPGCERCSKAGRQRAHDARRGSARARGYDSAWDRYARAYLERHPLCAYCGETCAHCGAGRAAHADAPPSTAPALVQDVAERLAVRSSFSCPGWFGRVTPATCVDHVLGARARPDLFAAEWNHAPSCGPCNTRKANLLEGGGWRS